MTPAQKQWIDNASYTELLGKWRFASIGDQMFQGEDGDYYAKVMFAKKDKISNQDAVQASKTIGWDK